MSCKHLSLSGFYCSTEITVIRRSCLCVPGGCFFTDLEFCSWSKSDNSNRLGRGKLYFKLTVVKSISLAYIILVSLRNDSTNSSS